MTITTFGIIYGIVGLLIWLIFINLQQLDQKGYKIPERVLSLIKYENHITLFCMAVVWLPMLVMLEIALFLGFVYRLVKPIILFPSNIIIKRSEKYRNKVNEYLNNQG